MRDTFAGDLAKTVHRMICQREIHDMNYLEICEEYYGEDRRVGSKAKNEVRTLLPKIKQILIEVYNHDAALLGVSYYDPKQYNRTAPETIAGARVRLPKKGNKTYGLWISHGENDLIMQADLERNDRLATGGKKKTFDRATVAIHEHRLPIANAKEIFAENAKDFAPINPELVKELLKTELKQLPPWAKKDVVSDAHTASDTEEIA